jgi:hypothetical protein
MRLFSVTCLIAASLSSATPATAQAPAVTPPAPSSPLSIRVGDAELLVGGFLDATIAARSTATGTGLGTSFGTIPFGNTPQGNLSELEMSAQNSRVSLQATSTVGSTAIKGYVEADFLGTPPGGLSVTTNSNTLRMRLYWAQLRTGRFEFLAGQSWGLLTPNRRGLSPMPADVFSAQNVDPNLQGGLTWTRAAQFRFIAHPRDDVAAGVALENPEQFTGSAVVLPKAFPAFEVDTGSATTTTPNRHPDLIGKVAWDPKTGKTRQHVEGAILFRGFKTYDPAADRTFSKSGVGGALAASLEPMANVRLIVTSFFSNGGGRYLGNLNGPDMIVNADGSMTLVESGSVIGGAEVTAGRTLLYAYYSHAHFEQRLTTDVDGATIGFGVPGSTAANHTLSEATAGVTETLFRDPKIGGLQLMLQYSHVDRHPFSVPAGTPANASVHLVYVNVRYILP